ncbi:MAG: phosphoglycolate phosphatase-like HAD superfamily hydrolase [Chlamydiales bacterium]|jgi:phosphoglycolate phosphatase-like HAD superfamily hydrolase
MAETPTGDFPFDAVLFDLDGTLVATDRFWPDAARAGALRAFEELGLEREIPSRRDWMGMVGYPLKEGFARVFDDLDDSARGIVLERCVEEEHRALRAGGAVLLPGAQAALEELRAQGVRVGIASNCGRSYLEAMLTGLGLERWVEESRCLDSPGVDNKADMIEDLLWTFNTRSAVMVGDRISDRDAAWANGLPHVHLARGFAEEGEVARCEAVIDGLDELLPRLRCRSAWVRDLVQRLELTSVSSLALTGGPASGKTLLARDLARELDRGGRVSTVIEADGADEASLRAALARASESGPMALLVGRCLRDPGLVGATDRTLVLEVSPEVARRRLAGRDGRSGAPDTYQRMVEAPLRAESELGREALAGPGTVLMRADNPLGPASEATLEA